MSVQPGEWIYKMTIEPMQPDEFLLNSWINEPSEEWPAGPFGSPVDARWREGTGFPLDRETPIFQFDRSRRNSSGQERSFAGVYGFSYYWLVSDALRTTLLGLDPSAFDMVECQTQFPKGEAGPRYWLTDVVRVCDCVDEERSRRAGARISPGRGWVELNGLTRDLVFFQSEPLRDVVFFRVPTFLFSIFCTTSGRQHLLDAGFDDFTFREVGRVD